MSTDLAELIALTREHLLRELDLGARFLPAAVPAARESVSTPDVMPQVVPERLEPQAARPANDGERTTRLAVIAEEVKSCTKCRLHEGRTNTVFARGNPDAELVFVGEGPGYNEDQKGLPFVGAAGQLLDKMIAAMGFSEREVYICNVVKCRPPENRTPNPDEAAACKSYLDAQLEIVAPRAIVALGRCAAENLGLAPPGGPRAKLAPGSERDPASPVAREGAPPPPTGKWRGIVHTLPNGTIAMPTYHPAYLLRSPEQKRVVWQDLQAVVAALGRELPKRSGS